MSTTASRVLLIDDDDRLNALLTEYLGKFGYAVRAATRPSAGLRALKADPPDLVILDVMLPEMDGYEVCRRLRALPQHIPIVMLTARSEPIDKLLGLELGADLYLTKPFDPLELLAHLKAIFRLLDAYGAQAEGLPLTCGPLTVWDAQHRVELNGRPIELTPKEYELLRVLMQRVLLENLLPRRLLLRARGQRSRDGAPPIAPRGHACEVTRENCADRPGASRGKTAGACGCRGAAVRIRRHLHAGRRRLVPHKERVGINEAATRNVPPSHEIPVSRLDRSAR